YDGLSDLIYTNEEDRKCEMAVHITHILTEQFGYNISTIESKNMMHQVIDNLIKNTFTIFSRNAYPGKLQIELTRNTRD
ncbi:12910_t:CDS:1, partial [Dentiscutata erythropus]